MARGRIPIHIHIFVNDCIYSNRCLEDNSTVSQPASRDNKHAARPLCPKTKNSHIG
uniref:Uncharacterized protein n=1 Tax=Anguilla anguilla TaxID=7936 RepID=A0A0E9R8J3_ANGAN